MDRGTVHTEETVASPPSLIQETLYGWGRDQLLIARLLPVFVRPCFHSMITLHILSLMVQRVLKREFL